VVELTPGTASTNVYDITCIDGTHSLIRLNNGTMWITNGQFGNVVQVNTSHWGNTTGVTFSGETWINNNGVLGFLRYTIPFQFTRVMYVTTDRAHLVGDMYTANQDPSNWMGEFVFSWPIPLVSNALLPLYLGSTRLTTYSLALTAKTSAC